MMTRYKLLLTTGFLVNFISGWAYKSELKKIIKEQNVERLKVLVPQINAGGCSWMLYGTSLVTMAANTGNVELTGLILDIKDMTESFSDTCTALCDATRNSDREMVKLLLARGIDPHVNTGSGTATKNASDELIPFFLAVPQFRSETLISCEQTSTLRRLLKKKYIDPNLALNEKQDRPLHMLVKDYGLWDRFHTVQWNLFIRHGADPELKNADGKSPRDLFVEKYGQDQWVELNQAKKMVRKKIRKKKVEKDSHDAL